MDTGNKSSCPSEKLSAVSLRNELRHLNDPHSNFLANQHLYPNLAPTWPLAFISQLHITVSSTKTERRDETNSPKADSTRDLSCSSTTKVQTSNSNTTFENPSSSVRGFSIAELLRASPVPFNRSNPISYVNEQSSESERINLAASKDQLNRFKNDVETLATERHFHLTPKIGQFLTSGNDIIYNASTNSPSTVSSSDRCLEYSRLKTHWNTGKAQTDNHLNTANKGFVRPSRSNLNENTNMARFDWLQCTRYKPPKLPRTRRRDTVTRRKMGRNPRVPFTASQLASLESRFRQTQYLSSCDVAEMSSLLHLTETRVKIWFQNRRARERRDREAKNKACVVGNPVSSGSSFQHLSHIHSAAIVENNTLIASLNSNSNSAFSPVRNTKDQINFQQPALPVPLEEVPLQLPKILSSESSTHELKNYIDCETLPDDENESQNQFDTQF
ncbi:Homeobox protein MSX-1 [Armadillidium nasatum]|uniref:Homeobox protein MSX-1 n=1 Tax=Armadillidium nasatum TaxID=96803 RepID=A0A5N5SUP2_9CRUS|nr:Homeobox protein MSX-1 [Armadillidium nasatum]